MAAGQLSLPKGASTAALALARFPGWLTWEAMLGLVQIFADATIGPLGASIARAPECAAGSR